MRKLLDMLIYLWDSIIPKSEKQFIFASFPDVSDNSYGMFKYIHKLYRDEEIKIVWLLSDTTKTTKYKQIIGNELKLSESDLDKIIFVEKNSIIGLFYYMRSKYVFFTHGLYPQVKFPKTHILVNLWHGMPLKTIGYLDDPNNKNVPDATFTIATSSFFQQYMAKAFGMEEKNVIVSGQPRNDSLFEQYDCLKKFGIKKDRYKKIFLWTPTYRQAIIGYVNTDGEVFEGLPVIAEEYETLNTHLKILNSCMVIKLHPMDILNRNTFEEYSNLFILTNDDLEEQSCQLSQLMSKADVLITDSSSSYIDFLLLDRPIGFVMDDFDKFSHSRGFIMKNPKDYMPGEFISLRDEYFDFLIACVENKDEYIDKRKEVNNIFNEVKIDFSKQLWDEISMREKIV